MVSRNIVNTGNKYGDTPLHEACLHYHENIVRVLISAGADTNIDRENLTPEMISILNKNYEE